MSYTDTETVRRYLLTPSPATQRVSDQPVTMPADESVRFFLGAVDPGSLVVKARHAADPIRHMITLTDGPNLLSTAPLVPGSVVVASDSSLATIYAENVDYIVDHAAGTLTLKEDGSLASGQTVAVWHTAYTVCVGGEDYDVSAAAGRLSRRDGLVGAGEMVYLDYTPSYLDLSDELVESAVTAANGMVEREVDPDGEFEADATLTSAATNRALELMSRAAATRELASLRGAHNVALTWLKLADDYAARADALIKSFRAPLSGPRGPVLS